MTSLDSYITLGRSGLRVSPIGLGTMTFGEDHGWGSSVATSETILTEYLDRGGNLIDTANGYTNGHSEKIIGDYFAARPGLRDRVVLSTKFLSNLFPGDPNGGGGGRKAMIGQLDESLRRLQSDYVDLYWLHGWDRGAPIEETLRSLLERTPEGELVPMAQAMGIGVMPWSPLRSGKLTGKYTREGGGGEGSRAVMFGQPAEHEWPVIDAVAKVATELGVSSAEVALAWVIGQPGIGSTLIGARTVEQLRANLASLDVALTPEQRAALDEVSAPTLDFPSPALLNISAGVAFGGMTVDGTAYPAFTINGKQRQGEY
jgi:aryl-alcohol dehydrogenase-like predicted oxidoreductase